MPAVIGHRGWPSRFPDNTLSGFQAAATVASGVELDVRRSADGRLVLSHDPDLGGLEVASHPWATLVELDLGNGHRPALLDEVIAALPDTTIQFEIKNLPHQPGFEPDHRVGLEAASRARPGDVVTSFYWATLDAVRRSFPDVATGALLESRGDIRRTIEYCLDVSHRAVLPQETMIDERTAELIAESGLESYAWTVNDPVRAVELAGLGVSGIITNDPGLMAKTLGSIQ
jgi:glycerophosphoryl diester phosphodiesterase